MPFRQRERGSGSATTVPSYSRIQDGDGTTLADVVPTTFYQHDAGVAKGTQTTTTLVDTDKAWTVDGLIGMTVVIHLEGGYAVESQVITDNDATSVTVGSVWTTNPTTLVTHYKIMDSGNALLIKGVEFNIDADEINVTDMKGGQYKTVTPALPANADTQVNTQEYGFQVVTEIPIHQSPETLTWNTNGTLNTYLVVIGGLNYTITATWNTNGTLASTATVVT